MNDRLNSMIAIVKYRIILLSFALFLLQAGFLSSQEVLGELQYNPVIINQPAGNFKTLAIADTLPFIDDFSKPAVYPDPAKWQESNSVTINTTYPIAPVTLGVATFDGLDETGYPYNFNVPEKSSSPADILKSVPLKMGGALPEDSVYFSFFLSTYGAWKCASGR